MPLIGTRDRMGVDDRAAPSKVANNENGDKSIERVKQYVLIVARISRILRGIARADRSYISVNKTAVTQIESQHGIFYCKLIKNKDKKMF